MAVEIGETVTLRNWTGEWYTVRVQKLFESKQYGPCVGGIMMEDGIGHKNVALPLSHLIEHARANQIKRGTWEITLPDGEVVKVKSKKAAQELCVERGLVFQEV